MTVLARFMSKVVKQPNGCWQWIGARKGGGQAYGAFRLSRRLAYAHRVAHELFVGPIPDGLQLDHLCRNTLCVNPDHLEVVTSRVNTLRGDSPLAEYARRTHCAQGHRFTPENTFRRRDGGRGCLACRRAHRRAYHRARRERAAA